MNVVLCVGVVAFVTRTSDAGGLLSGISSVNATTSTTQTDPLDQLSSADIAVNLAQMTSLPETQAVTNQAQSANADLAVASAVNTVIAKPQEVATTVKSRQDIQEYVVQPGDSVTSIAAKFNINTNSLLWSNGLTTNNVQPGLKLTIPPINGIVVTVKSGDTAASLAQKYQANQDQIVAFNDAEISGLKVGEQIVIPNGQLAATKSSYGGYSSTVFGAASATYGGFGRCTYRGVSYSNYGYDCGFCTWWVAFQRAQHGAPVPSNLGDARTWKALAARYGLSEGNQPRVGAVMWFTDDHVAYVSDVASDGTVTITEMNHIGWGIENSRTFAASDAGNYTYIY